MTVHKCWDIQVSFIRGEIWRLLRYKGAHKDREWRDEPGPYPNTTRRESSTAKPGRYAFVWALDCACEVCVVHPGGSSSGSLRCQPSSVYFAAPECLLRGCVRF